jgi:hypothetical protein
MKSDHLGIATGGMRRLRQAIEAQVRAKYQDELSKCTNEQQKVTIREKIAREVKEEMKRVSSPYSLWNSQ